MPKVMKWALGRPPAFSSFNDFHVLATALKFIGFAASFSFTGRVAFVYDC